MCEREGNTAWERICISIFFCVWLLRVCGYIIDPKYEQTYIYLLVHPHDICISLYMEPTNINKIMNLNQTPS